MRWPDVPTSTADPMLSRYTASSTTRRNRRTTHSSPGSIFNYMCNMQHHQQSVSQEALCGQSQSTAPCDAITSGPDPPTLRVACSSSG